MKILLLSVSSRTFYYDQLVLPFGLCALGAYVQGDGHTIQGIEMNGPPGEVPPRYLEVDGELLEQIKKFDPDLVAMSTYAANIHNVLFWAQVIKKACPGATISVGGNHASYISREVMESCPAVDIVLRFEGEMPFKLLCDRLAAGDRRYDDIPNATFRKAGKIVETEALPLLASLDDLPPLDRSLFESGDVGQRDHADIISARGCPFHCTFCNCNHYWQKRYRMVSVDRVVQELRDLKARQPGLRTVRFRDEAISINRRQCSELCEALASSGLNLEYHAHSRLDGLDPEVIGNLARAGFRQLFVGLESGSQAVLDRLQKGIKIERVKELMPAFREHGLKVRFSLMLGTPGESLEESQQTVDLVNDLDLTFDEFYFGYGLVIYPGTTECEKFKAIYPDYQWLKKRQLRHGYSQQGDQEGNPVAVWCHGAKYGEPELKAMINERLGERLARYDEHDYDALKRGHARTDRSVRRAGGLSSARSRVAEFLARIDAQGLPWAVVGGGYFFSQLIGPGLKGDQFKHCRYWRGVGDLRGVRKIVVAVPGKSRRFRAAIASLPLLALLRSDVCVLDQELGEAGADTVLPVGERLLYKLAAWVRRRRFD